MLKRKFERGNKNGYFQAIFAKSKSDHIGYKKKLLIEFNQKREKRIIIEFENVSMLIQESKIENKTANVLS